MRLADRLFGWLLVLGGLLHAGGSWSGYRSTPELLLWALSGSLAAILLGAMNIVRAGRLNDRPIAWLCLGGCLAWIAIAWGFGRVIGNMLDPRALIHAINAAVLAGFSLNTIRHASRDSRKVAA